MGAKPGDIVDPDGRIVGAHEGLMFHTIGQRQGLGIGGPGEPWFVIGKDIENKRLIAAQGKNHPLLFAPSLSFSELTTTSGEPLADHLTCTAKIRYRQQDQACKVLSEQGLVHFDDPQRAIAPRQSIVFYDGDVCLGGAIIDEALRKQSVSV